ncbi:MAG TPA: prolipoprotein diacylglyceryl transferase [Symbiobacteriaceae bacterium]|jgi:phosphatidylglycerol:prolipoprotein diacylglycerol transferase
MLTLASVNPILFHLGPITVRWYGVIFVTGIMVAIWLAMKAAEHRGGLDPEFIPDLSMFLVPGGILGARLYEVFVLSWPYYRLHPSEILAIWQGGLAIHGGVLGALLLGGIYVWYRKQPFWLWADMIGPGLILAQAIGRWGNFFNQEAFGSPAPDWLVTKMPAWLREGMTIQGTVMHPTFLYESLWNLLVFGILFAIQRRKPAAGVVFSLYLIGYNIGRYAIESIREDSTIFGGGLRVAQVAALLEILAGLGFLAYHLWRARAKQSPSEPA